MKKAINVFNSEFYKTEGEDEALFGDIWIDCDYLKLFGENTSEYEIIYITDGTYETDELIYMLPIGNEHNYTKYAINYIEKVINDFYNNEYPEEHGFVSLNNDMNSMFGEIDFTKSANYVEGRPIMKYRGGKGYSYSFWQYNK